MAGKRLKPARSTGPERQVAAFLLGLALFLPPLLLTASVDRTIGGVPLLVVWIFGGWLALIAVIGWSARGEG